MLEKECADARDICDIIEMEKSNDISDLEKAIEKIRPLLHVVEVQALFTGEFDHYDAIVNIQAGAGGTEAQDWTEILLRMMLRYCERKGYTTEIIDTSRGLEAGIKNVSFTVKGDKAYGNLRSESGVHRLVRISPFDADKARHTSFSQIEVIPDFGLVSDIVIEDKDIRIDVYRASGHGGQGVNTTDSAVRINHIPTGIVVTCQNERSQTQNKETAMNVLKSKLKILEYEKRRDRERGVRGERKSTEWGSQIRSYVLYPYQLVKDVRTGYETNDTEGVLNGKIEEFVEAYLKWDKV